MSQILLSEIRGMRTEMNTRLDKLVTAEAFAAEQRRVDERHLILVGDIADERASRKADILNVRQQSEKLAANVRWAFAAIVIPSAGVIAAIFLVLRTHS